MGVGGIGYDHVDDGWGLYKKLKLSGDKNWNTQAGSGKSSLPTFFGVGEDNTKYDDDETTEFVKRSTGGQMFWWKEDPQKTIYTINNIISEQNHRIKNFYTLKGTTEERIARVLNITNL